MKIHKNVTIDLEVSLGLEQRPDINISEICNVALRTALEMKKPEKPEEVAVALAELESRKKSLLSVQEQHVKERSRQAELMKKDEFIQELKTLASIRKNNSDKFVVARKLVENKYNLTNAQVMKELEKY